MQPILLKAPLLLAGAFGVHIGLTDPNPSVPRTDMQRFGVSDIASQTQKWQTLLTRVSCCEILAILAALQIKGMPDWLAHYLIPRGTVVVDHLHITPIFITGILLQVLGAAFRIACYRTLGRHFTYVLSMREDHKLVTAGPYSIVRHPSYTALIMQYIGTLMVHLGEGSWLIEGGILDSVVGRIAMGAWVADAIALWIMMISRTDREDRTLKEKFGAQWVQWSKQTPYRLVPGIY
ncbi:hypothetical protein WOLCODRAFT_110050 [Wolfiporia cocos MD-104 SS10]|uniref:Protein-S-isoprenylcysteine O-methyltransferase n=1 Tax=Wolfiporia cocos (strain MD-104) TaxID=742152 RepID=A0A2H3JLL7_WOLCO|nr:hypothetical protein WOLCODRAFT_110050 [Wolfiporia cocos MD-104 SS10]